MSLMRKIRRILLEGGYALLCGKLCYKLINIVRPYIKRNKYLILEFFLLQGYWPSTKTPRSFSEKILYKKLGKINPLTTILSDKWAVREYVNERLSENILNEVYWVGCNPDEIPFDELPNSFVIKATHGSGWNIIVHSKEKCDKKDVIRECKRWIATKYSSYLGEYHYDSVPPQIIVERLLYDKNYHIPLDYKFFCFHGKVKIIQVDIGRYKNHRRNIYDRDWNEMPFCIAHVKGENIAKPGMLSEMIVIAEKLSGDLDFCRVDLYYLNNEIVIFGEITFTPGGGIERFYPRKWDFRLGELL